MDGHVFAGQGGARGFGPNGAAGAAEAAGAGGVVSVVIQSVPSSFFIMKVGGKDRLLNPAQVDALQSGATDEAELAEVGPKGDAPIGAARGVQAMTDTLASPL